MSNLQGPAGKPAPTIRELANAARIGRARFIGNSIGAAVLVAIVGGIYIALGSTTGFNPLLYTVLSPRPGMTLIVPSAGTTLVFALASLVIFLDLAVRRRHDRNRSGVDVIVWAEVALGDLVLHLFGPSAIERLAFDTATGGLGLWLLVVLVLLPGARGPNAFGEDPREMLHRAN